MAQKNILASGTGVGTSKNFEVKATPVVVAGFGTFGSDTGNLQRQASDGSYVDVYDLSGTQVQIKAALPSVVVEAPGRYRVQFSDRDSAIGVDAQTTPV